MKRIMIWSGIALMAVAAGIAITRADYPIWQGRHGHGPFGRIAHELNLTDAQKSQVKALWQAERSTVAPLIRELSSEAKDMQAARANGTADEKTVQAIADRQGATIAKLLAEKEKLTSNIYNTVLTPAQRTKANQLLAHWESRLDRMASRLEQSGQ